MIIGCDRVAANGDVANKVGTYAAWRWPRAAAGIPFVVAGPDLVDRPGHADRGRDRDRGARRRRGAPGRRRAVALPDTPVRNPAFDVTPGRA